MTPLADYAHLLDKMEFCPVGRVSELSPPFFLDDDLQPVGPTQALA